MTQLETFNTSLDALDQQCKDLTTWISKMQILLRDDAPVKFSTVGGVHEALVYHTKLQKEVQNIKSTEWKVQK